jgi:hypothetical protein
VFGSIWRHGGVFLLAGYEQQSLPSKLFRLVNDNGAQNFLPPSGSYPNVGYIEGFIDSNAYKGILPRFDDGKQFDESNFAFDEPEHPVLSKTLALDLTIDQVLFHNNTLGTNSCLNDLPWLNYMEDQARLNKKITEDIIFGCQLTMATDSSGFYTYGGDPYSMAQIRAKFQVIQPNWDNNSEYFEIRLGTGIKMTCFLRLMMYLRNLFSVPLCLVKVMEHLLSRTLTPSLYR